ncbi:MAG: UvrD-helicase domain-containing protein [Clostridiales bacterium]|nr:UvrD-helicase domain-containing protein [Clostridiales bacterium]
MYRPDFYLPDYDIYIEHFGITRDYKTPWLSEIESEKYIKSIYWKRDIHKANGTLLLETYSYMNKEGILLSDLKKMLIENNVIFKPLDNYEVYTNLFVNNNDKYIGEFKKLIKTFLGLFKSNGYTSKNFNDLRELILKNDSAFLKQRALVFMDIMEPLFDYYTNYLEINRKIDFNDMINMATDIVKGKSVSLDYDYIIIDEYQDISMSRFNLIKEIKNQTNAKVIAVGDDWQSIYRFAGSDINLFTDFEKYFGVTEVLKIEKTYRNSQELVNIASRFVMQNNRQIKKKLISDKHNSNPVRILGYEFNVIEAFRKAIDEIVYLNGEEAEILLLGRNNFDVRLFRETKIVEDEDEDEDKNKDEDEDDEDLTDTFKPIETDSISIKKHNREYKIVYKKYPKLKINYLTVHRSKGLEADNVIILNLTNNIFGFPNRLTDDPILSLVITDLDDFDYAEERRLFYVAITRTKNVTYLLAPQYNQSVFTDELIRKQNIGFDTSMISEPIADNPTCPVCEKGFMVLRENSITNNKFLGCTNYPLCNNTFKEIEILNNQIKCNVCGGYMVRKNGIYGEFYGCTNFPDCRNTIKIEKDYNDKGNVNPNTEIDKVIFSDANEDLKGDSNKPDSNAKKSEKVIKPKNKKDSKKVASSFNKISNDLESKNEEKAIKAENSKNARKAFDIGSTVKHGVFGVGTVVNNDEELIKVIFEDANIISFSSAACINSNILFEIRDESKSVSDTIKNKPDHVENYLRLARHHAKLNNIEEAVDLYTSVLKVSKDNQEAIDFLSLYGKGSIMNSKHSGKKQSMQFHRF